MRSTYLSFPRYAARSKIARKLLSPGEVTRLSASWNVETDPRLFTIGYEGLTIDGFLDKLIAHNVLALVDVRHNAHSMKYGFSRANFSDYVQRAGISYYHIRELGIPAPLRKDLATDADRRALFRQYARHFLPQQDSAKRQLLALLERHRRLALVCFESDPRRCHRLTLVEQLKKHHGLQINTIHL